MAKDAALEDKWKQRVEEYRQSGLSIRDWCRKNKFKETTFKYWIYKFNNSEQNSSSANTDFAEVLLPSANINDKKISELVNTRFSSIVEIKYFLHQIQGLLSESKLKSCFLSTCLKAPY